MNISKLFKTQAELDKRIVEEKGLQGQDLLDKKILALQVELGELANEWREFKFWSDDQKGRIKAYRCINCYEEFMNDYGSCPFCEDEGKDDPLEMFNPLLEEYIDCLHFILSIGLELEIENFSHVPSFAFKAKSGIVQQFNVLFKHVGGLKMQLEANITAGMDKYTHIVKLFIGLGEMLGFTWEQIEQAYFEKNKVNHARQENGY